MAKQKNIKVVYQVDTSQVKAATAAVTQAKAATDNLKSSTKQLSDQGKQNNAQFKSSIGSVIDEMNRLRQSIENMPRHHTQQIDQMRARYKQLKQEVDAFNKSLTTETTNAAGAMRTLNGSLNGVYNAVRLTLTAGLIKETADAVIKMTALAGKVEGVKRAFDKLPKSTVLMDQLRKSTHGTLTDLELMQRALQARNFQIPLENMSKLLEFASIRAQQTGQSVDYLVESIVLGLGYNSIRRLDNVGLSVEKLKLRMAETGQTLREAFGEFIDEELVKMGSLVETGAVKVERLSAAWKELGAATSKQNQQSGFVDWLTNLINVETALTDPAGAMSKKRLSAAVAEVENFNKANKEALKNKEEGLRLIQLEIDRLKNLHLQNSAIQKQGGGPNFISPIPSAEFAKANQQNAVIRETIKLLEDQERQLRKSDDGNKESVVTIKSLNDKIDLYNQLIEESTSIHDTEKLKKLEALRDQTTAYRDALLNLNKVSESSEVEPLVELTGELAQEKIDFDKLLEEDTKRTWDGINQAQEQGMKESHDLDVQDIKDKEKWKRERERIYNQLVMTTIMAAHQVLSAWNQAASQQEDKTLESLDRQLDAFDRNADNILKTTGDNARRRVEVETRLEKEREKLQAQRETAEIEANRRQAAREKKERLRQIAIDTAAGIVRALTVQPGLPAGWAIAGILAGEALVQAAIVNKFKKGVIDLKGPGTETSDSIPAMLSRRETVMTAEETKSSKGIFKSIRARKLNDKIFEKLVVNAPATQKTDFSPVVNAIERNRPGDLTRQGSFIYEVKDSNKNLKRRIRKYIF